MGKLKGPPSLENYQYLHLKSYNPLNQPLAVAPVKGHQIRKKNTAKDARQTLKSKTLTPRIPKNKPKMPKTERAHMNVSYEWGLQNVRCRLGRSKTIEPWSLYNALLS